MVATEALCGWMVSGCLRGGDGGEEVHVWLRQVSDDKGWRHDVSPSGHLHSSHCQNNNNSSLLLATHLKRPDEKHRQDGEDEIPNTRNSRVSISGSDDDRSVKTRTLPAGEPRPEVLRRNTLKDKQEKEESAVQLGDNESDPKNVFVDRSDA